MEEHEPTVTITWKFKKGTKISDIDLFINKYCPTVNELSDEDMELWRQYSDNRITVTDIPCPICSNPEAEYGCFDAEMSCYCDKCQDYFFEVGQCPTYKNPSKEDCDKCVENEEIYNSNQCKMRVTADTEKEHHGRQISGNKLEIICTPIKHRDGCP